MLYHQGQRNYECPKCNNKFYQMEHLKRHLTSIHKLNIPQIGRGNRLFGSDLLKRVRIHSLNLMKFHSFRLVRIPIYRIFLRLMAPFLNVIKSSPNVFLHVKNVRFRRRNFII